jgi:nitrite reductase/ring-hydroxylating ferredoxin subunit
MTRDKKLPVLTDSSGDVCAGCTRHSRRDFLGQISAAAIAAAIVSELSVGDATALPVSETAGKQGGPDERTYPLPASDGVTIDRDAQVILARYQGRVFAFNLACPHENTALKWRQEDVRFQCPRHQSKYQPDGTFISGRATRNMDRFAIRRNGDQVIVDLNQYFRSDQQADKWAAAVLTV